MLGNEIVRIEGKVAAPFIKKWHYSNICPTGMNIHFGWYIDNELYAVITYGIGVNHYQAEFLKNKTGYNVTSKNLLEIKRLCRTEPKLDEYPLSYLISKTNKLVKQMGYEYVVSFSDPMHGHSGGIYKASNFTWLGNTAQQMHLIDSNNNIVHKTVAFRLSRRSGISMHEAVKELGLKYIKTLPKDRWFIKL